MYMIDHADKMSVIRTIVKENALKKTKTMVDTVNTNTTDTLLN
jgi:nitrogen regulatory protein PII-like uncharacterized protein